MRLSKILPVLFLLIGMVMVPSIFSASDEFAPKVKLPKNLQNRDLWVKMVDGWKLPQKDEVGVPAYPGAVVIAFKEAGLMTANGKEYPTLPSIVLASEDDPAKVADFYKDKLKDWKYKNAYDMFDIFWDGPDDFNSMDVTQGMTMPNLVVQEPLNDPDSFKPEAKSQITIVFKPVK